ncbi:MAG: DUF368 domain-containing protein [Bacilli bacterium]|nr:DUF368 domain-containing protein [Bacilli bacterium]
MYDKFLLVIKGAIIGVANIIPGVSGGTLAITMGLYEKLINAINTFFKNFKENIKFLFPLGVGAVLGFLLVSKLIVYSLDTFPVQTNIFFSGLILGGVPMLWKKVKDKEKNTSNIIIFIIVLASLALLTFAKSSSHLVSLENLDFMGYFLLFIVGIIAAATMVIPGISGSFILMLIGYYRPILDLINELTKFYKMSFAEVFSSGLILVPFGIGVIVGFLLIAKLIEYLLNKFEVKTYYAILGFVLGSVLMIIKPVMAYDITLVTVITSIIFGLIGMVIAHWLGER